MKQKMSVLSIAVLMLMVSATAVMVVTQAFNQDFNRALGMISPGSGAKLPQNNAPSTNVPTTLAPTTKSTGTNVPNNSSPSTNSANTTTNNTNSSPLTNPSSHGSGNYTGDDHEGNYTGYGGTGSNHTAWDD